MERVLQMCLSAPPAIARRELTFTVVFLIRCFASLESPLIMNEIKPLFAIGSWVQLPEGRRESEMLRYPKLAKLWKRSTKLLAAMSAQDRRRTEFKHNFLGQFLRQFGDFVDSLQPEFAPEDVEYCARTLELLIDLEVG